MEKGVSRMYGGVEAGGYAAIPVGERQRMMPDIRADIAAYLLTYEPGQKPDITLWMDLLHQQIKLQKEFLMQSNLAKMGPEVTQSYTDRLSMLEQIVLDVKKGDLSGLAVLVRGENDLYLNELHTYDQANESPEVQNLYRITAAALALTAYFEGDRAILDLTEIPVAQRIETA